MSHSLLKHFALLMCAMCLSAPLLAGDAYRWVDDAGLTQISDVVPEKYKRSAIRIGDGQAHVSEDQQALNHKPSNTTAQSSVPKATSSVTSQGVITHALNTATSSSNELSCEQLMREYQASKNCFATYGLLNGAIRAEAYTHCTMRLDPSYKCDAQRPEK
jgi:Domain of unknown function (DUF4124)